MIPALDELYQARNSQNVIPCILSEEPKVQLRNSEAGLNNTVLHLTPLSSAARLENKIQFKTQQSGKKYLTREILECIMSCLLEGLKGHDLKIFLLLALSATTITNEKQKLRANINLKAVSLEVNTLEQCATL